MRIRVIIEFVIAFAVIALLATAIAGVVVVKFHGEDLKSYFMDELNDRLDTRIDVDEVSVKVFHKFPNTSIVLKHVTVWSSHNFNRNDFQGTGPDTLATAESVSASFNLFGMIRKRFNIKQIEIRNGSLHLLTDTRGEGNYMMFRKNGRKSGKNGSVSISHVSIQGFRIRLDNQAKQLKAYGDLENLELNGRFSKRGSQIRTSLKGTLIELSNKGILYASDNHLGIRTNMDLQDSIYAIRAGHLQIDRINADVDGRILYHRGRGVELDLVAAARNLEIHEVLDLIPGQLNESLERIRGNGNLQVYTRVTGMASSILTPSIEADFQAANANLFWDKVPFSLKSLNLSGSYSNGGKFSPVTTRLTIGSFSAVVGRDHISGKASVDNFLDPDFSFDLKGEIHPSQWLEWYSSIPVDRASGTIYSDMKVSGSYERNNPKGERFRSLDITGGLSLEDLMVRIARDGAAFESLNGNVHIDNDTWEPSFSGKFGKSDFSVSGTGRNLISFLLGDEQPLIASVQFRSGFLDLREVLDQLPKNKGADHAAVKFPENLDLRFDFAISDFHKDLLEAKNARGTAFYDTPLFYVDSLTMQTMGGRLKGAFGMTQNIQGSILSNVDASMYNLDISELFRAFNNFGQNQLTAEHLKGTISGTSAFSAEFDPSFRIKPATILSENNITIRNGELNGFTPLLALSRFIEVEELESVRFETLKNNILVKDSQVTIPSMDIHSSALDLEASGTHRFDNTYDYRLKLKLSDLLYNKAGKNTRNSEFVVAEDASDKRTLFLKVSDDGSGSRVEIDKEQTAKKVREGLREERTELQKILNEELGLFKNKQDLRNEPDEQEGGKEFYRFEFQEDSTAGKQDSMNRHSSFLKPFRKRKPNHGNEPAENKPVGKFVIDE